MICVILVLVEIYILPFAQCGYIWVSLLQLVDAILAVVPLLVLMAVNAQIHFIASDTAFVAVFWPSAIVASGSSCVANRSPAGNIWRLRGFRPIHKHLEGPGSPSVKASGSDVHYFTGRALLRIACLNKPVNASSLCITSAVDQLY